MTAFKRSGLSGIAGHTGNEPETASKLLARGTMDAPLTITMIDATTGEARVCCVSIGLWNLGEGNFSCDCNRGDLFYGLDDPQWDVDAAPCGSARFHVGPIWKGSALVAFNFDAEWPRHQ